MTAMASSPCIQETTARRKVSEKFGEIRKFDFRSENCIMSMEKSLDFQEILMSKEMSFGQLLSNTKSIRYMTTPHKNWKENNL